MEHNTHNILRKPKIHNEKGVISQTLLFESKLHSAHQYSDNIELWGEELLIQLSQHKSCLTQNRWILLIAPKSIPTTSQLNALGIDSSRIIVINKHQIKNSTGLVEKAMTTGSFSAVLSWLPFNATPEVIKPCRSISEALRNQILSQTNDMSHKRIH